MSKKRDIFERVDHDIDRGDFSPVALATGFEGFPNHTQLSTQYQSSGIVFTTAGSSPQANNDFEAQYGPLASGNILATGTTLGSNQIELRFLDPLTGGPAGQGWPFGRDVYRSEILHTIDAVPGVDHVITLALSAQAGDTVRAAACDNLCVPATWLVASAAHAVRVLRA